MKKVYGSFKIGIFTCAPFYIGLWAIFKNPNDFLPGGYWYLAFSFLICCGGSFLFSRKSFWVYGEKGIEILNFNGEPTKKYGWNDVSQIGRFGYRQHWPFLEMKDGRQIWINFFITSNYWGVLSEVVKYVQSKCPETYIEPHVSKFVERGRWYWFF